MEGGTSLHGSFQYGYLESDIYLKWKSVSLLSPLKLFPLPSLLVAQAFEYEQDKLVDRVRKRLPNERMREAVMENGERREG